MISHQYKKQLQEIHESSPFGKRSKMPRHSEEFIAKINPQSILDFGCGKGRLVDRLKEEYPEKIIFGYDPGNSQFDHSLDKVYVDLLMSTDVLEHVEPEHIDQTLEYLSQRSRYIYHLIALSPAKLILPDGRNAHLILESKEWWRNKFLNLGYTIIKEDYLENTKIPKGQTKAMLIKKYFIMAEIKHGQT